MSNFESMKNIDICTVDPNILVDIETVNIDTSLPPDEKFKQFVEQIKNPYLFKCNGVVVKLSFSKNGGSFQENFENYLSNV